MEDSWSIRGDYQLYIFGCCCLWYVHRWEHRESFCAGGYWSYQDRQKAGVRFSGRGWGVSAHLLGVFQRFAEKGPRWQRDLPSAVKCLERSIEACLAFFICPEGAWISLRTTNIIEHLNKEFKRRTKPMEIAAGENVCYTLLAFICLKMELHWRSNPIGKVSTNLPFLKELEDKKLHKKLNNTKTSITK